VKEASDRLVKVFLHRKTAYADWVREDAQLLAGVAVASVTAQIFPPPYADGVLDAIDQLRSRFRLGILSSGVDLVADRVAAELGLDFAVANRLFIQNGHFTGEGETRVDLWRKDEVLRRIAGEIGVPLSEICFVGDHINDIPVMRIVGLSIAVNPKDEVLGQAADYVVYDFAEVPILIEEYEQQEAR
jgi:phosphoserine phosphatase